MKNKTAKEAVAITLKLWSWMKRMNKTSWSDKRAWPPWADHPDYNGPEKCPLCTYVHSLQEYKKYTDCYVLCPLKHIWPFGCMKIPSPYLSFAANQGAPEDAQAIIDGCSSWSKMN